jgi:nitrite reductase/ring-hydroxylating ferredoxin subunit
MSETTRRTVLAGAVGIGATVALAACGSDSNTESTTGANAGDPATSAAAPAAGTSSNAAGGAAAGIATADIPVGGGKIFTDQKVVVTQPTAGTFKAFNVACTHAGCPVSRVANGTIDCTCHGSKFSVEDGSVKNGPASKPLAPAAVTVNGDKLILG